MPDEGAVRRPTAPRTGRRRTLLLTLVVLGALLILFSIFTNVYTDLLWYDSVGFSSVFSRVLVTRLILFVLFGLVMAGAIALNFVLAYRSRPVYQAMVPGQAELDRYRMVIDPYRKWIVLGLVTLIGLLAGASAGGYWLDRYSLATSGGHVGRASFTGLTYTDVNAVLPGRTILAAAALICGVL